jgi:2-succinyl-5-enolpyruvyl-6-hydroxy-3-cyclohexene-1-carboxylate synthase
LVVGNSLPVREVDAFARASVRNVGVLGQRGANGIDGVVSGAAGAAMASKRPTLLLVGDVSFAHDLSGLALARRVETPLVIVVIDNEGGRIFEHLPAARLFRERPEARHLWLTPPEVGLEDVARAFGLRFAAPASHDELVNTLGEALREARASIVHVRVPPDSSRQFFTAVFQRLGAPEAP